MLFTRAYAHVGTCIVTPLITRCARGLTAYLTDVTRLSPLQSGESLVYFYVVDNFMHVHIAISVHTMYVRLVMYSHVLWHCIFLQVLLLSLSFLALVHIHPGKILCVAGNLYLR